MPPDLHEITRCRVCGSSALTRVLDLGRLSLTGRFPRPQDPDQKVGYIFASFWPTGETRNYDPTKGEVARPKILNPITGGGFGGVELAVRYDYADLTDAYDSATTAASRTLSQDAGKYTAWTFGVNYYPTAYVRLQANYTKGKNNNPVVGRDVDTDVFQMRAQLDF